MLEAQMAKILSGLFLLRASDLAPLGPRLHLGSARNSVQRPDGASENLSVPVLRGVLAALITPRLDALCEDHVSPLAQDVAAGLLEQDAKREQGRLIHAGLVNMRTLRRHVASTPHTPVEPPRVAVDGFE